MQTVYDWATMIVFAGLIVLFLQRSQGAPRDHLWQYLVAAVGCAATNYLGNEGIKRVAGPIGEIQERRHRHDHAAPCS